MQWHLTRIVSMSAAFEIQEVVDFDNGDSGGGNDFMLPVENLRFNNVLRWIASPKASESSGSHTPVPRTP